MADNTLPDSSTPDRAEISGHQPVMLAEAIDHLQVRPGGRYIDATFGGGGHSRAILEASAPDGRVLALDADPEAIRRSAPLADAYADRFVIRQGNFSQIATLARAAGFDAVDGVLMDLGFSSFQIDDPRRGFSFQAAGPLDMRFDPTAPLSAREIVNTWPEEELVQILFDYGEESRARRIARAIVTARRERPIETTDELAALVERAVGGRRGRAIHPATKTFQALRIAVNRELEVLEQGLNGALDLLAPGGRLVVIAFHSLEDRMVKQFFRTEATDCICPPKTPICVCGHQARLRIVTSKAVQPSETERAFNPRSRSARLRAAERLP